MMNLMRSSLTWFSLMASLLAQAKSNMNYNENRMSEEVVNALRISCSDSYIKLFPSIQELHLVMELNANVYGPYINEAKEEFSYQYQSRIIPQLKSGFELLIEDGRKRGIVWNEIELIDLKTAINENSKTAITFMISSGGKVHRIQMEDVIIINGQWRPGRSIKFV